MNMQRVQRVTSKGQFTIPSQWRNKYGANQVLVNIIDDKIVITPIRDIASATESWETIWSAKRDNAGNGIAPNELLKIINKIESTHDGD